MTSIVSFLSAAQIGDLTTTQVASLKPTDFAAMGTTQASGLTSVQVPYITPQDFVSISTAAVAALQRDRKSVV